MAALQTCERQRGDSKCAKHPHNEILYKCEQCGILVCGECVTSKEHQGHQFTSLKGCYKQSKDELHSLVWKLENKFLPKVGKEIDNSDHELADRDTLHDTDVQSVTQLRQKCLDDMNTAFHKYLSLIDSHTQKSKEPILQYKVRLKLLENDVQTKVTQFKSVLETGTELEIHDDEIQAKAKPEFQLPKRPDKDFADRSIPYLQTEEAKTVVQEAVSLLDVLKSNKKKGSDGSSVLKKQPEAKDAQEDAISLVAGGCTKSLTFTPYKLRHLGEFYIYKHYYSSLCPISADTAWFTDGYYNDKKKMNLINSKGEIKQTIKAPDIITSISAHPLTGQLYVALWNGSVGVVKVSKSKGLFQTKITDIYNIAALFQTEHIDVPQIAVTIDDHIVLCSKNLRYEETKEKHIFKYTLGGKRVSTSDNKYTAYDVSVCTLTNHVAVACGVDEVVVVLDDSLKEVFKYTQKETSSFLNFLPWSAVFDGKGNVLVGDGCYTDAVCLHVVDGKSGQCLQVEEIQMHILIEHTFNIIRLFQNMLWTFDHDGNKGVIKLHEMT